MCPGGIHHLAGVSQLQKAVNATRSAFVLNAAKGEREQQDKPRWEPQFGYSAHLEMSGAHAILLELVCMVDWGGQKRGGEKKSTQLL